MPVRSSSLQHSTVTGIDREIGSQYDNVKIVADNIEEVGIVSNNIGSVLEILQNMTAVTAIGGITTEIVNVSGVSVEIVSLAGIKQVLESLYNDKQTLDSLYADKLTLDSIYNDKITLDSIYADKATLDSLFADKATLDSIYNDKATLDSLYADKAVLDSLYADKTTLDRIYASIDNIDRVHTSIDNVDMVIGHVDNVDTVADNITSVVATGGSIDSVNTLAPLAAEIEFLADNWDVKQDANEHLTAIDQELTTTSDVVFGSVQLGGGTGTQGTVTWNADEETLDVVQNGATLQVGQEVQVHCRNASGGLIANGTVVMATGTIGASGRITVAPYDNTAAVKYVMGIATEDIADGDDGKITKFGKVRGVDTLSWNEGDVLYTTANGGLTNVEPASGIKLPIAFVVYSGHNGVLMVRSDNMDENAYEPADSTILKDADIGNTVQPYNVDTVIDGAYVHTDNNYTTTEKDKLAGIEIGATADQLAVDVPVTPVGNLSSDNVQAALEELQADIDSVAAPLSAHEARVDNPHAVTKAQVGLGNVDNTSDLDKPISTATQTAINGLDTRVAAIEDNTTLAEYGITDAYTKAEVDTKVGNADSSALALSIALG